MDQVDIISNRTFDEIAIGDSAKLTRTLRREDILPNFPTYPAPSVSDGMWMEWLVLSLLATKLPGPGTQFTAQSLHFYKPLNVGNTITAMVTVRQKKSTTRSIVLECNCTDGTGAVVVSGSLEVVAPTAKCGSNADAPSVPTRRHEKYDRLISRCRGVQAITTAVVYPCDEPSLTAVLDAASVGLLAPILVGPSAKIADLAEKLKFDLSRFLIEDVPRSEGAAERAVELVRGGKADLLMKGSLHTDELLSAVVKRESGLRTQRRISHCFIMDIPTYHKPLIITDAAVNVYPTLVDKADIVQNAIDLSHSLGLQRPHVAILSAVETVNPKIQTTLDAAALCKMADRKQITGAVLDGPLAMDNAISKSAAAIKGIDSPVAGEADILVVPDLEAGNMLYKNLTFLAEADGAGIVLGARVPIILTSRADSIRTRLASCAVAVLYAHAQRALVRVSAAE